jgi:hypothetical protein
MEENIIKCKNYTIIIIVVVIGKTAGFEPKLFLEVSARYVLS